MAALAPDASMPKTDGLQGGQAQADFRRGPDGTWDPDDFDRLHAERARNIDWFFHVSMGVLGMAYGWMRFEQRFLKKEITELHSMDVLLLLVVPATSLLFALTLLWTLRHNECLETLYTQSRWLVRLLRAKDYKGAWVIGKPVLWGFVAFGPLVLGILLGQEVAGKVWVAVQRARNTAMREL